MRNKNFSLWRSEIMRQAIKDSFVKLNPRIQRNNIVMFIVELGAAITTVMALRGISTGQNFGLELQIALWLWFTVLFANFSEALAERRGQAQVQSLRQARSQTFANLILNDGNIKIIAATNLHKDNTVLVKEGETIPGDGEVVEGAALVDESAITGESAPVVREPGGNLCGVTGGTKLISGQIKMRILANPGETFLDQMIAMVESAKRQKSPNEWALEILLIALTIVFIVVVVTLIPLANYSKVTLTIPVLIALLVCLMPTTIGGLLPAIGIAGMERLLQHNVISLSGKAIEASGNVDVVLMDKTGTITLGNRMATEFILTDGINERELAEAAMLSSLADETPEGRSIVDLSMKVLGITEKDARPPRDSTFVPFSAATRMSGINIDGREIRKGASDSIAEYVKSKGGHISQKVLLAVDRICQDGSTPLVVAEGSRVLGAIRLKDVIKKDIKQRLSGLHKVGINFVLVTGDNELTAAAIAEEAGIEDFVGQARPETKLDLIRKYQADGHTVAMIGDGTNDAPALAQADVAVAMNSGTQAAREAANMVDMDSSPGKLLDIVEIGKQILITRGALTTFSVANDVSKYFTILPAMFAVQYPMLNILNIMHLTSPNSAILAAVIFNALIIPLLIPLALRGVKYKPNTAESLLRYNLLIYGGGGLVLPFMGIKLIDMIVVLLHVI